MTKIKIFMNFPQSPQPTVNSSVFSVREEVETVIYIIDLVLSVVGSVVGNLITKWFGRKK